MSVGNLELIVSRAEHLPSLRREGLCSSTNIRECVNEVHRHVRDYYTIWHKQMNALKEVTTEMLSKKQWDMGTEYVSAQVGIIESISFQLIAEIKEIITQVSELYVCYFETKGTIMDSDELGYALTICVKCTKFIQLAFTSFYELVKTCLNAKIKLSLGIACISVLVDSCNFTHKQFEKIFRTKIHKEILPEFIVLSENPKSQIRKSKQNLMIMIHQVLPEVTINNQLSSSFSFPRTVDSTSTTSVATLPLCFFKQYSEQKFKRITSVIILGPKEKNGKDDNKNEDRYDDTFDSGICWNSNANCLYVCTPYSITRVTLDGHMSTFVEHKSEGCLTAITIHKSNVVYTTECQIISLDEKGNELFCITGNAEAFYYGITVNPQNDTVFVTDYYNHRICMFDITTGEISTLAGPKENKTEGLLVDGKGTNARFARPRGILFDESDQSLLVCDEDNNAIRRVTLDGDVSIVCKIFRPRAIAAVSSVILVVSEHYLFKLLRQGEGKYSAKRIPGYRGEDPVAVTIHKASQSCFVTDYNRKEIFKISFA